MHIFADLQRRERAECAVRVAGTGSMGQGLRRQIRQTRGMTVVCLGNRTPDRPIELAAAEFEEETLPLRLRMEHEAAAAPLAEVAG